MSLTGQLTVGPLPAGCAANLTGTAGLRAIWQLPTEQRRSR